jgi:predicted ribosomally synthesized peptide with SipW-like signal peptide
MRKLLVSAGLLVFVGAVTASATGAFFSDTQTSTGNVFTAGSIVAQVDDTQHYNNAICTPGANGGGSTWQLAPGAVAALDQYPVIGTACDGTWALESPIGPQHKFFDFGDVKPGDKGEDTLSLHVTSNPAWACLDLGLNANNDNGTTSPEVTAEIAEGINPALNGPNDGRLAQNINIIAWLDSSSTNGAVPGDNIWQAGEPLLFKGGTTTLFSLSGTTTIPLADSTTGTGPLSTSTTNYIGIGWCAGTITIVAPGVWTCDGSTMGNDAQTDSATTTVQIRVTQSRNQPRFSCVP